MGINCPFPEFLELRHHFTISSGGNGLTSGGRRLFRCRITFTAAAFSFSLVNPAVTTLVNSLTTGRTASALNRSSPALLDGTLSGFFMPGRK